MAQAKEKELPTSYSARTTSGRIRNVDPGKPQSHFCEPCNMPNGRKKKGSNLRKRAAKIEARGWTWPPPDDWNADHDNSKVVHKRR